MLTGFAAIIPADSEAIRNSTRSGTVETVQNGTIEITISGRIHAYRTGTCSFYLNEDRIFCTSLGSSLKSMHSLCAKKMTVCGRLKAEGGNKKKVSLCFWLYNISS
jgi:hypothetical protein